MDNNTLLFQDKGSGRYKDVKIYPNRIEVLKKGTFGGKHTEIVYLKDITGVNRIKGRDVFLRNRLLTGGCGRFLGPRLGVSKLPAVLRGLATLMWTVPGGARETGGPYMRDPRHPRHFTDEFKRQIVDLYNAGKPKREIMDEYDLGKSTVERWIKSINATGSPRAADNRTPEQNRILELERENRRLRMEVDVLKQAALIYARK